MRIFAILVVKNESDIIEANLAAASRWADRIFVYDNGSTDGTLEAVTAAARGGETVVLYKSDDRPFSNRTLHPEVFNACRGEAREGDWWCRLDADEFYVDDPRAFLGNVAPRYAVVWTIHLQYYFTEKELELYEGDREAFRNGPGIMEKCRHYLANASEARFFRHRDRLRWGHAFWPKHMGLVCPERILVKHYQYRSPEQIGRRIEVRRQARRSGALTAGEFDYDDVADWRSKVEPSSRMQVDRGDGKYVVDPGMLPNHLEAPPVRLLKVLLHGLGVWP